MTTASGKVAGGVADGVPEVVGDEAEAEPDAAPDVSGAGLDPEQPARSATRRIRVEYRNLAGLFTTPSVCGPVAKGSPSHAPFAAFDAAAA